MREFFTNKFIKEIINTKKFIFLHTTLIFIFMTSCNNNASSLDQETLQLYEMTFDVVEKELILKGSYPKEVTELIEKWFDVKVKINGFDGKIVLTFYDYLEEISKIKDGKRIDISLKFNANILNNNSTRKKNIEGEVKVFGTLTGDFTLNEFDIIIQNTQNDLITVLSRDLKEKI